MLDKKDSQWWILEAQKRPDTAPDLIRMLADRLSFLDKQNEELRGEVITLKRRLRGDAASVEVNALRRRIQELESALRDGQHEWRVLVYAQDRIEFNSSFGEQNSTGRLLPGDMSYKITVCSPAANLIIITADSRAFSLTLADLPSPDEQSGPAFLGNPRNVAAILDKTAFDRRRFLALVSQRGYVYSLLAGTINTLADRQEKLVRNLIPGDPIVNALPTYNTDLFAISARGRWVRFPERSLGGSGSLALELPKGDTLAAITPVESDTDLIFLTADNRLYARESANFATRKAPGTSSGMILKDKTILGVTTGHELAVLTRQGRLFSIPLQRIRDAALSDMGVAVPGLAPGDSVITLAGY